MALEGQSSISLSVGTGPSQNMTMMYGERHAPSDYLVVAFLGFPWPECMKAA
jgi:hypothetical protein